MTTMTEALQALREGANNNLEEQVKSRLTEEEFEFISGFTGADEYGWDDWEDLEDFRAAIVAMVAGDLKSMADDLEFGSNDSHEFTEMDFVSYTEAQNVFKKLLK